MHYFLSFFEMKKLIISLSHIKPNNTQYFFEFIQLSRQQWAQLFRYRPVSHDTQYFFEFIQLSSGCNNVCGQKTKLKLWFVRPYMCEIYVASAEILQPKCIIKQEIDSKYRLIILRKFLLFTVLFDRYFTQQYWNVQFF